MPAMTLTLYRRHKRTCPNFMKTRREKQRACNCKFWVDGVLAGREVRMSLDTRDLKKASQKVHEWESKERVVERGAAATLAEAWTSMIADLEARKLSPETVRKYKLLERQMKAYAKERGLIMLAQFDLDLLSQFRATWADGPRTASKKLERLRAFFRFAHDRQWIETNPATRIKLPKVSVRPTMPLTQDEMLEILKACDGLYATTAVDGKLNAYRLKTLVLLMRYTGMRVSDAVTLTADRLNGKRLFLYTQKTGVPVYTVLPDSLLQALDATPRMTSTHYFWTGVGKRRTVVTHWQRRLKMIFDSAKVSKGGGNAVSHRFRDTFAVELLLAGVPIERVAILLGHQSVRITEKHYNPWVKSRQEQLEADVTRAWTLDPILSQKTSGTNPVHLRKEEAN
jgi:site-specific recombinase XerD